MNELISTTEYQYKVKVKLSDKALPYDLSIQYNDKANRVRIDNDVNDAGESVIPNNFQVIINLDKNG